MGNMYHDRYVSEKMPSAPNSSTRSSMRVARPTSGVENWACQSTDESAACLLLAAEAASLLLDGAAAAEEEPKEAWELLELEDGVRCRDLRRRVVGPTGVRPGDRRPESTAVDMGGGRRCGSGADRGERGWGLVGRSEAGGLVVAWLAGAFRT
jgi:hypothetical protein